CWGDNSLGQVSPLPSGTFSLVGVGYYHNCGVRDDGTVACWGYNGFGQAPQVSISPPTLPDGTEGDAYSQQISASGGASPYTFGVVGGSLPPGLSLSGSGLLSGNPTTGGTFTFTVQAVDDHAIGATRQYTVNIA